MNDKDLIKTCQQAQEAAWNAINALDDGYSPDLKGALDRVRAEFDDRTVQIILAYEGSCCARDGRISPANLEWCRKNFPQEIDPKGLACLEYSFISAHTHMTRFNGLISEFRATIGEVSS